MSKHRRMVCSGRTEAELTVPGHFCTERHRASHQSVGTGAHHGQVESLTVGEAGSLAYLLAQLLLRARSASCKGSMILRYCGQWSSISASWLHLS